MTHEPRLMPLIALIVALLVPLGTAPVAQATQQQWKSNAGTATWATGTNWVSGTAPVNSFVTDTVLFNSGTYSFQPTATSTSNVAGLTMGALSGAVTITTGTTTSRLGIGTSGIVMNSGTGTLTIGAATTTGVELGGTQAWQNDSSSLLSVFSVANVSGSASPVTLTLSGSGSGGITIGGVIADSGTSGGKVALTVNSSGSGVTKLTGVNTYTGGTTINAGTLDLGGGTSTGSLGSTTVLNLGGGTLSYTRTGTRTQAFTTTNLNAGGASSVSAISGNILNLGTIANKGGTINFGSTGAGIVGALAASNTNGIISGATFNNNTWAVANGAGVAITGLSSYTTTTAAGTAVANYASKNIDVTNSAGTLAGVITANSLRFNTAVANTVTLAAGTNALGSSGILVTSTVGNNLSTIAGGDLTGAASKSLVIIQNNTSNGLTISSKIINNTSTGLSKFGNGTLTLTGANTYSGGTTVSSGVLQVNNSTGSGTGTGAVTVSGRVTTITGTGAAGDPKLRSGTGVAVLAGTGTVGGNVTVGTSSSSVGVIKPGGNGGADKGTLTIGGSLTVTSGSQIQLGISTSTQMDANYTASGLSALAYLDAGHYNGVWLQSGGTNYDTLKVTGGIILGTGGAALATIAVTEVAPSSYQHGMIFKLIDWNTVGTGSLIGGGSFNISTDLVLPILSNGNNWDTSAFTKYGVVVVAPEPGRIMLMFFGLAALLLRRRRK